MEVKKLKKMESKNGFYIFNEKFTVFFSTKFETFKNSTINISVKILENQLFLKYFYFYFLKTKGFSTI